MTPELIAELEEAAAQLQRVTDLHNVLHDDIDPWILHRVRLLLEDRYATLTQTLDRIEHHDQGERSPA